MKKDELVAALAKADAVDQAMAKAKELGINTDNMAFEDILKAIEEKV